MAMFATGKSKYILPLSSVSLIYICCILIAFSTTFKKHSDALSTALVLDLTLTAPFVYFLLIRKSSISKSTLIRVVIAGIFLSGLLLSKNNSLFLHLLKTWLSPFLELLLVFFLVRKFYTVRNRMDLGSLQDTDFLCYCRSFLKSFLGSAKLSSVIAAEISIFYYAWPIRRKQQVRNNTFSSYKESGSRLILGLILFLLLTEATSMHFLFFLWNKTAAWIITTLSLYTCLQLYAHIQAIKLRPIVLLSGSVLLRNGLWGGEADIAFDNIEKIEASAKPLTASGVLKLALLKKLDSHNVVFYLKEPITVIGAMGMSRKATILLVYIDDHKRFLSSITFNKILQEAPAAR